MTTQKDQGQYMTPKKIVEMILDEINYTNENVLKKTIIEPSFGDGNFLIQIIERIIEQGEKNQLSSNQLSTIIKQHVFGIEKDEILYQKTINRLNEYLNKYKISINWNKNLFCGDTLLLYHQFENKFDYVVGNPPFVRIHNINNEYRKLFDKFQFTDGMIDLYILFYEIGIKMLNDTGTLGFISPNSFLKNTSQQTFRDYLIKKHYISKLYDFKTSKLFTDASTYTCICILDKVMKQSIDYKEYDMYEKIEEEIIDYELLMNKSWNFCKKEDMKFLEKIEGSTKKIKDIATVQNGITTNKDDVFIHKIFSDKELTIPFNNKSQDIVYFQDKDKEIIEIESEILKQCVKISKYNGIIDNTYIIFPYDNIAITEDKLMKEFPKTYKYLKKHYNELIKRDIEKTNEWYLFGRSQGLKNCNKKKIIFKHIINKKDPQIITYLLNENTVCYSGIYTTTDENIEELKKIFESKDFSRYCSLVGKDMNGGYISVSSKMIKDYGFEKN